MSRFVLTAQLQLQAPNNVAQVVRQIQSQLNNVTVNLNIPNAVQAQRQLQQITTQTQAASSAADRMGRAFALSVRRFAAFSVATRAVTLFTATLSKAIQTAIDFEREIVKISQVTGQSVAELRSLTSVVTELSTSLGVSSTSLIGVGRILSQAGFQADDLTAALKTLAKTELAPTFENINQTAEGAIAIFNQFGLGAEALEEQLGAVNAVAGKFAVEAGDLIGAVRRVGGVFKASGGNLNELLALFTSVRATTRESAESIATGLRTIFTRIQRPKTIEFLKQFGVELIDLEGKFVGPFEAVKRLSGALAGLGEGDLTFIRIAEELGGFRQIGKVLPLLQQFAVAQDALNTANKAGNSLTKDAATAQQALSVRVTKVKEEFLALIRSITETKTFQIMANTALSLASALVQIGEAIKPLLPLLAAVAAINFAKGIGTFAGGLMRGMQSGRTYSTGGKVHHFARGGMVPGTGNSDTVPAMLQPGEFVIKKSSVNKLGASNLAAMNENRYEFGGPMTTAQKIAAARADSRATGLSQSSKSLVTGNITGNRPGNKKVETESMQTGLKTFGQKPVFKPVGDKIGAFVLTPPKDNDDSYTPQDPIEFRLSPKSKVYKGILKKYGASDATVKGSNKKDGSAPITAILDKATYPVFYPGLKDVGKSKQFSEIVSNATISGFGETIKSTINTIQSKNLLSADPAITGNPNSINNALNNIANDNNLRAALEGYLFEGILGGITNAQLAGGRSNFDLPYGTLKDDSINLQAMFGQDPRISGLLKAEVKRSKSLLTGSDGLTKKIQNDINENQLAGVKLVTKHFGGLIQKFAVGGNVGTDTVPALLTPGEFVVNRSSAQSIGYSNLNRMNKVGKYAKGGVVQGFNAGTSGTGVRATATYSGTGPVVSGGDNLIPFDTLSLQARTLANAQAQLTTSTQNSADTADQNASSMLSMANNNKVFAASMATSLIAGFLPAIDESSSGMLRLTHNMLGLATTLTSVMFALQTFGVALSAKSVMQLFGTGPGGLGSLMKNAFSGFKMGAAGMAGPQPLGGGMASRVGGMLGSAKASVGNLRGSLSNTLDPSLIKPSFSLGRQGKSLTSMTGAKLPLSARLGNFAGRATQGMNLPNLGVGKALSGVSQRLSPYTSAIPTGFRAGFAGKKIVGGNMLSRGIGGVSSGFGTFGRGVSAGLSGKSVLGGGSKSILGNLGGLVGQGGSKIGGLATKAGGLAARAGGSVLGGLGGAGSAALSMAGPIAGVTAFVAILNSAVGAFKNLDGQLQKSIKAGKVEEASKLAVSKAAGDFPLIGNLVQGLFGDFGDELLVSAGTVFGGPTLNSVKALAAAQAGAVKTQKQLDNAQKTATTAMEDFQNGSITAAEALSRIRAASSEVVNQQKRSNDAAVSNLDNRAGGGFTGRNIASFLTFGAVESSSQRNDRLGKQSAEQIDQASQFEAQRFQMESGARSATIRSGFARGESAESIRKRALGTGTDNDLQRRLSEQVEKADTLRQGGDTEGAEAAQRAASQLADEINQVNREMANLEKEVARTKAALKAVDLGLRGPIATATAMSASMDRFNAGLEVGGSVVAANTRFLAEAMTSAAQAMDPEQIKKAVADVSSNLREMGLSESAISKFENNTNALVQAQQNYGSAFENIKKKEEERVARGQDRFSPDDLKDEFSAELTKGLDGPAKKNMEDMIKGMALTEDEVAAIMGGDRGVFLDKLTSGQKEQIEKLDKIFQERQKAEQVVIGLINQRADAERNLAQAQREAVDLYMEGRDVQGKYGGPAVSSEEKRAAILAKANAGAQGAGLTQMRTGSLAELRQRNMQTLGGFARVEAKRSVDGGMSGAAGAESDITQKNLQQAQKDQIQTIRDLIKLEEEELKIIQEKNKLEKNALESLLSGDIEQFFDQQAALGAQASIATGDKDAANLFGAKAVADAFKDIQRQQEAGVQSLFGRQLGGSGGLAEQAAGAALSSRGVTDPRMAQRLAGTTAEEEASKSRLRDLGGALGETGAIGQAMAEMQVQTAEINVASAKITLAEIEERGRQTAAGLARGGVVYADRGMFVPRGTDTVPAMLTPGEFVVRREAVNRGNNLQLLHSINEGGNAGGFARGGKVGYYNNGGRVQYKSGGGILGNIASAVGIDPSVVTNLGNVFNTFVSGFNESIKNLKDTKLQVKLDSVNVNVNFTGTSVLTEISDETRRKVIDEVVQKMRSEYSVGAGGKIEENKGLLPKAAQGS
jgi:TP901 family phage tail tape measure protein